MTMIWYQSSLWLLASLPVQGMDSNILDELCGTHSPRAWQQIPPSETENAVHLYHSLPDFADQTTEAERSAGDLKQQEFAPFQVGYGRLSDDGEDRNWLGAALKSPLPSPNHVYHHGPTTSTAGPDWIESLLDTPSPKHATHTASFPASATCRDKPSTTPVSNGYESLDNLSTLRRSPNFNIGNRSRPAPIFAENLGAGIEHTIDHHNNWPAPKHRAQDDTLSPNSSERNLAVGNSVAHASEAVYNSALTYPLEPQVATWESVLSNVRARQLKHQLIRHQSITDSLSQHAYPVSIRTTDDGPRGKPIGKKSSGPPALPFQPGNGNHQTSKLDDEQHITREKIGMKTRISSVQNSKEVSVDCPENWRKRKPHDSSSNQKSMKRRPSSDENPPLLSDRNGDKSAFLGQITNENNPNHLTGRLVELCRKEIAEEDLELPSFDWDLFNNSKLPYQGKPHQLSSTYHNAFKETIKEMIQIRNGEAEQNLLMGQTLITHQTDAYQTRFKRHYKNERSNAWNGSGEPVINSEDKSGTKRIIRPRIRDTHLATVSQNIRSNGSYLERRSTHQIQVEVGELMDLLSKIPKEGSSRILKRVEGILPVFLFYVSMMEKIVADEEINSPAKVGWKVNEAWQTFKLIHANIWVPDAEDLPKIVDAIESDHLKKIMETYERKKVEPSRQRGILWNMLAIWLSRCNKELFTEIGGSTGSISRSFQQLFNDIYIYTEEVFRKNQTKP